MIGVNHFENDLVADLQIKKSANKGVPSRVLSTEI